MGCRCKERRAQLADAARFVAQGRVDLAATQVRAASRSLAEDARALAARISLARGRVR